MPQHTPKEVKKNKAKKKKRIKLKPITKNTKAR